MAKKAVANAPSAALARDLPAQDDQIQLPSDSIAILLTILMMIALLFAAYVAADIVLPIVLAFVLKLLFQPGMRLLEKLHIPPSAAALLLILVVFGAIVGIGAAISGPATEWAKKLADTQNRDQQEWQQFGKRHFDGDRVGKKPQRDHAIANSEGSRPPIPR